MSCTRNRAISKMIKLVDFNCISLLAEWNERNEIKKRKEKREMDNDTRK